MMKIYQDQGNFVVTIGNENYQLTKYNRNEPRQLTPLSDQEKANLFNNIGEAGFWRKIRQSMILLAVFAWVLIVILATGFGDSTFKFLAIQTPIYMLAAYFMIYRMFFINSSEL